MIQVYTGSGKGKTTAVLGLALRAAGAGLNVYVAQFMKGSHSSELNAIKKIKKIKIEQFGKCSFIKGKPNKQDIKLANMGLKKIKQILSKNKYDLVVMDEVNVALKSGLIDIAEILEILKLYGRKNELILSGRYAHKRIIECADLVSKISNIKHYFQKGIKARKGIEY